MPCTSFYFNEYLSRYHSFKISPQQNYDQVCARRAGGHEWGGCGTVALRGTMPRGSDAWSALYGTVLCCELIFKNIFLRYLIVYYNNNANKIPRKRSQLSQLSATAQRLRLLSSDETDENMHTLATQRVINEQNRAMESSVECYQR